MCQEGRPDETEFGVRIFAGEVCDAYLQRADVQRGYTIVVWRGRHVAEPTELEQKEATAYWHELLRVGQALESYFQPVELNYELLGNSLPHLHAHVLPRYADDPRPGWPFPFPDGDPGPSDEGRLRRDVAGLRRVVAGERATA